MATINYLPKRVWFIVFNATVNNISVVLWWSVLLVEETGGPEKTTDLPQVIDKTYREDTVFNGKMESNYTYTVLAKIIRRLKMSLCPP
jgi:hypothetical protein